MNPVAGVDLGKTGCRARVLLDGAATTAEGPGAPGLAEPGGVEAALDAVWSTLRAAHPDPAAVAGLTTLAVGAAGAEAAPDAAHALAEQLARRLPDATVAVTSDSVTAHVGALGGRPGTVLAVGTGAVALGFSADGDLRQVDGWGPWLGDEGSGAWLGRAGLRAVLRAHDGRGPATALTDRAVRRFGEVTLLPRAVAADRAVARTCASFVPDVIAAAEEGDAVAGELVRAAAQAWVELVTAAGDGPVTLVGGLAGSSLLTDLWRRLLPEALHVVDPQGTALDGAVLLATRSDLPHESRVLRLAPTAVRAGAEEPGQTDVDLLPTEQVRGDLDDLDRRDPAELVDLLLEAEATVPRAVAAARDALARAVRLAGDALDAGGRLVYVGAGTPGRLAALDAAECPPTFGTAPDQVVAVLAGGGEAAARAVEGAEDDAAAGARDLAALDLDPRDLVVGITASGRTPYVLAALQTARAVGCATVAIVNNAGSPARDRADVVVELLTGPEVLAGSTRLKAGTAQKVALNALSTGAMIRHGKTYGAWMVDVMASNEKLRRRARRILREATGVDDARATAVLDEAAWRTKPALVALLAGVDVRAAADLLDATGGRVRDALARHRLPAGEVSR